MKEEIECSKISDYSPGTTGIGDEMCTFSRVVQYQYWIIRCEILMLCYLPVYPWRSNFLDRPFQRVCECLEGLAVGITCLCLEGPNRDLHGACPVRCLPIWECDKMR